MKVLIATAVVTSATANAYCVVDSLPPPATCPGLTGLLITACVWADDGAGGTELVFQVTRPGNRTDLVFENWQSNDALNSITAQSDASGFTVRMKVAPSAMRARFRVDVHCTGDDGVATVLEFSAQITSVRSAGTSATVAVSEGF